MVGDKEIRRWSEEAGFEVRPMEDGTLELTKPLAKKGLAAPPIYVQITENWVCLSMLDLGGEASFPPDDVAPKLLAANRDIRVVKFALSKDEDVVLCAELPTESLDQGELVDAALRLVTVYRQYKGKHY
jgi:hypothetical protein